MCSLRKRRESDRILPAIIELTLNQFNTFRQRNPIFFWIEDRWKFVLLKPFNDAWLRTVIEKTGDRQDVVWKEANLSNVAGGIQVAAISGLDDEKMLGNVLKELRKMNKVRQ